MKPSLKTFLSVFSGLTMLTSCETQIENPALAPATAEMLDFTKYIAVGSSMVAGYTNGGLYRDGQLASYPNLIAQQTGAKFEQALFPMGQENGTGYLVTSAGNTSAQFDKIIEKTGIISTSPLLLTKYSGKSNNFGVATLRMSDMGKAGLGNVKMQGFNPYFERILPTGKEDITYPDFVKESNPTFFTVSIGEYDMLAFATSGGKSSLTETSVFALNCQKLLDALVANKAKGIITNLPNVIDFPYFNFYSFEDLAKNIGVSGIYITTGNGIVRLATTNDRILLDAIPNVGKNNASGQKKGTSTMYPLTNEEVLDKDEVNSVASRLTDFNGILKLEAEKRGIASVDLNSIYKQIQNNNYNAGNGIKLSNSLLTGNFFSLDGINPTPRGSAVIANEIIKSINENYKNFLKTVIPTLDVSKFEALKIK
ncbi:SGNH/GDSL hydrolase family protein [Emticicia sp.]|uniref:SGNH/GDSL hydrolase family protein n=1 Tax=Emticicia sp. TaxID=1930953 RepID=UPI0037535CC1